MLLGKRLRPPMKRTTSMSEFAPDMTPPPPEQDLAHRHPRERQRAVQGEDWLGAPPAPVPRGGSRRNSADFAAVEMAPFLKACGLCKRRLGPGKDIFMYRGHIAFCSLECRQQQINLDERKEKCSASLRKKDVSSSATVGSEPSNSSETVTAV